MKFRSNFRAAYAKQKTHARNTNIYFITRLKYNCDDVTLS